MPRKCSKNIDGFRISFLPVDDKILIGLSGSGGTASIRKLIMEARFFHITNDRKLIAEVSPNAERLAKLCGMVPTHRIINGNRVFVSES